MGNKKTIKAIFSSVLAFCFLAFSVPTPSLAAENNEQQVADGGSVIKNDGYESNRFIVKYKSKVDKEALASIFDGQEESIDAIRCKDGKYGIICTRLKSKSSEIYEKLKVKNLDKLIEYIQPDYSFELSSNDPYFDQQWGIQNTSVTEEVYGSGARVNIDANVVPAWEVAQGEGVIVAVADTGIDINHEDLKENIWVNAGEIPGNGIDDDGNGFIDDTNGWDFYDDTADVSVHEAVYGEDHGTHIAGIIAAVKDNGKGIAGVAPKAKILPLKVFKDGKAYTSDIIEAIDYAEKNGAKVFNCSWGSAYENPALEEAIEQSGMLFVCAAGNSGIDIDQNPVYPAAFTSDNVVSVASLTRNGSLAGFSNYGQISVDVAAPGEGIVSTLPGNEYGVKNGTSMAAAFVSGEAALLYSKYSDIGMSVINNKFINSSDKFSTLIGKLNGENKINAYNALIQVNGDNELTPIKTDYLDTSSIFNDFYVGASTADSVYQNIYQNAFNLFSDDENTLPTSDPTLRNLFPQPIESNEFIVKGNGVLDIVQYCEYKYDYTQNVLWAWYGFDIAVDISTNYTYSFDAYISPDANIQSTGGTFIANCEAGFGCSFYYDNTKKGTWQHFEYTAKPTSAITRILLYPATSQIPSTAGYILYRNVEFKRTGTIDNLFPQPTDNSSFSLRNNGILNATQYSQYKYDYTQNVPWAWYGSDIAVNKNVYYTYSFDAYISPDANIQSTGSTFISNGEAGFGCSFYYDNTKKGTWQHFEYTAKPTSAIAKILFYPTTAQIPSTTGYILYRNVEFKQVGRVSNLFYQSADNDGLSIKGNGDINKLLYRTYKYDYTQNVPWAGHGFDIAVDINTSYTYSFDAYISLDANIQSTGSTFISNGEAGFGCSFNYDNTKKGTWQHFEYSATPTSAIARILLYPTTSQIPATTGYILYRNVEFKRTGTIDNMFPQPIDNGGFSVRGNGILECDNSFFYGYGVYKYDYTQNVPWTWHGFDIAVDINTNYTYSFDAFISSDANISSTDGTIIANCEAGFGCSFYYDNTKKGTWQHFEYSAIPTSAIARILLYPTTSQIPATTGYILYRNVEFKRTGTIDNLFPQPMDNNSFSVRGNGVFVSKTISAYKYNYEQNVPWAWQGFDIPVCKSLNYTYSFDAYISSDTNMPSTGNTFIASGEAGFLCSFYYDNTEKGTWQHFEYTGKPTSTTARILLYPATSQIPATTGYILYRNVEFKIEGEEWNEESSVYLSLPLTSDSQIDLVLTCSYIQINNQNNFTLRYNHNELELIDLYAATVEKDTTTGYIPGSNIKIIQSTPGTIIFTVDKTISSGKVWSGTVNIIKFRSKINGQTTLAYCIE